MFVLDTDPGVDDALALYLMQKLIGEDCVVISSYGNAPLTRTRGNLAGLRDAFGGRYPLFFGASEPLGGQEPYYDYYHGPDALGGASRYLHAELDDALGFREFEAALQSASDVTYCVVGPMTNLATLIAGGSPAVGKISSVLAMGGGLKRFNCPGKSEFNFHADPQAVKMVFGSGLPLTIAPFDLGMSYPLSAQEVSDLTAACPIPALAAVIESSLEVARRHGRSAADVHDCFPVLYRQDASAFLVERKLLSVDEQGAVRELPEGIAVDVLMGLSDPHLLASALHRAFAG